MSRLKVTPKGKQGSHAPITRIGKKQYLKRRFKHIRKVDVAGANNKQTQMYVEGRHTAAQNYTRLGLAINASASPQLIKEQKKVVKPHMKMKFQEPEAPAPSEGQPVSEQEGSMIVNLLKKYGTDLKRMSLDHKLNPFQLTPRQLQRRIVNYLKYERKQFPEMYADAASAGWLEEMSDKSLRKRKE